MKVSPVGAAIVAAIAVVAILSGVFIIKYAEAWFLVVLGWILVPVLLKKAYDRLSGGNAGGKNRHAK
jgi:hypothetical protein